MCHDPGVTTFRAAAIISLALAGWLAVACGDDGASTFVPADARPRADASPYDAALGVACKGEDCALGQACCRELLMPGQPIHFCAPEATTCIEVSYTCDGPEDCADGEQCCDVGDGAVECTTEACAIIVCHKDEHCPGGLQCCDTPVGVVKACQFGCG